MDYRLILLNRLLDKYEKSKLYKDGQSSRRILLNMLSKEFPEYDIENYEIKELINSVVIELKQMSCIDFEWKRFEEGNIIEKVWLNTANIEDVYKKANRKPKKDKIEEILTLVEKFYADVCKLPNTAFAIEFARNAIDYINTKKEIIGFLSEDVEITSALLKALKEICMDLESEKIERVLSVKLYGDSKYFERNVKRKLINVLKKYYFSNISSDFEDISDEDVLALVGIVKNSEEITFCGHISIKIDKKWVDMSAFEDGVSIYSDSVRKMEEIDVRFINKVIFIENKTNYFDHILNKKSNDELIVYHGGFYSPIKGLFFEKLYAACEERQIDFYHWSDIDIGGFRLFVRLKKNIIPILKPFMMDVQTFMDNKQYWIKFDKSYANNLKKLLENPDFEDFYELINLMLDNCAKLEQESLLLK